MSMVARTAGPTVARARRAAATLGRARHGTGPDAWGIAREAHARTGGVSSLSALAAARRFRRLRPAGTGAAVDLASLERLRRDGIAVLPWRLEPTVVDALRSFALTAVAGPLGLPADASVDDYRMSSYVALRDRAPLVLVPPDVASNCAAVQSVLVDPRINDLAAAYLGVQPVVGPAALTWTTGVPLSDDVTHYSRNATRYHWDFDGIAVMRVHVYVSDVGESDAPMRYVRGSHRTSRTRWALLRGGVRSYTDEEVEAVYGRDAVQEILGPAGTVYVTDPFGLHRGSDARGGTRLFLNWAVQGTTLAAQRAAPLLVPETSADPRFAELARAGDPLLQQFTLG